MVVYTDKLDTARKRIVLKVIKYTWLCDGRSIHSIKARIRPPIGAAIKGLVFDKVGALVSLVNNLIASANGWGIPAIDTLLGPLRDW